MNKIFPALILLILPFTIFAATVLKPSQGGTGLSSTPSFGQVLMGNGSGGYTLTATSSLGISASGGTGDVVGPASATDNAIVRFDSTTGKLVQDSATIVTDTGRVEAVGTTGNPNASGSTQVGSLRLGVSGGNNVLDFGTDNAGTGGSWIQAEDKTNLATVRYLTLNPNGGNVGINAVNNSSYPFQISSATAYGQRIINASNATLPANASNLDFKNSNTTNNNYSSIAFWNGSASGFVASIDGINVNHNTTSTASGAIRFNTNNAGTISEKIRIDSAGNLGVGTTTPAYKLDVYGNSRVDGTVTANSLILPVSASEGEVRLNTTDGNDNGQLKFSGGGDLSGTRGGYMILNGNEYEFSPGSVYLSKGNAANSFVYLSGNVGVNKTSPTATLDVEGTASSSALVVNGNATTSSLVVDNDAFINGELNVARDITADGTIFAGDFIASSIDTSSYASSSRLIVSGSATSTFAGPVTFSKTAITQEATIATSTSMTIDWGVANQQLIRLGTATTTLSFTNYQAGQTLRLVVCNPNATFTDLLWTGVLWPNGVAPTQTTTANKCDLYTLDATNGTSSLAIFGGYAQNY